MLDKSRNGAIVAIKELVGGIGIKEMLLFLIVALIVGGIASILTIKISKIFAKTMAKINYTAVILGIIIFIIILTFLFDQFIGFLILITSTAIGLLASELGVGKNHLMGCLILPVALFFIL